MAGISARVLETVSFEILTFIGKQFMGVEYLVSLKYNATLMKNVLFDLRSSYIMYNCMKYEI